MIMPTHSDVLKEAREWVGTPFHHQARVKGHGVDCAQLVIGVGQALGLIGEYPREYMKYSRVPRPDYMRQRLSEFMEPITAAEAVPGDVLWMGWVIGKPMHTAFLTDLHGRGILHAYSQPEKVVETTMPPDYEFLIDSWWRYKGLDYVG